MEVYLLFSWVSESPLPALLYLTASVVAGLFCIWLAKAGLRELLPRLRDASGLGMFLMLGKLWLIGVLLLFPGYLTDIAALCVFCFVRGKREEQDDADGIVEVRGRVVDKEGEN